ncbi:MAG: efflux RND transporter permease subunit [Bacteriovoracaceae bacterium]|nr:efflux RND transporter permease subunit [Bacteriovoracaceae bacterium]
MVKIFIRKGTFTICLNLLILLLGFFSLPYLSNEFIPSIKIPAVAIVVPVPLMPEGKVVHEVVTPIENAFLQTGELESVETKIEDNKAIIVLFYKWSFSPERCLRNARQVVNNIKLPRDALKPIFVLHRPSNGSILRVVFHGSNLDAVSTDARALAAQIERIEGIAAVALKGASSRKTVIKVDPLKLMKYKINSSDIVKFSKESWSLRKYIKSNQLDHYVTIKAKSESDLGLLPLTSKYNRSIINLRWLGDISQEKVAPDVVFGKKKKAVIMEVIKSPGADTISIIENAKELLSGFDKKQSTLRTKMKIIYNEALKIKESQNAVFRNFFIGVVLNSIILIIFLGSKIGVLVASIVFPTALLGTLFILKSMGISINLFSLNGFSLAVGMITDSSTVVLESITRKIQNGEQIFQACFKGAKEVTIGVIASTLTTAGVLLPIAMQKNISSKLFSDLAFTVISTQVICLIAVFSLVPWLCFHMFQEEEKPKGIILQLFRLSTFLVGQMVVFAGFVRRLTKSNVGYKVLIPTSVVCLSLSSILFLPKTEFLPMVSSSVYSLNFPLEKVSRVNNKRKVQNKLSSILGDRKDVLWSVTSLAHESVESLFQLQKALPISKVKEMFFDSSLALDNINILPVGPAPVGEAMGYDGLYFIDKNLKQNKKNKLLDLFCNLPIIDKCSSQNFSKMFQYSIVPKALTSLRMGSSGLESISQITLPLHNVDLADLSNLPYKLPFIMKFPPEKTILDLPMGIAKGQNTNIGSLFKHKLSFFDSSINRFNSKNYLPLYFRMKDSTLGEVDNVIKMLGQKLGVALNLIQGMGSIKTMDESFENMIMALTISSFIIFFILVIQFKSITQALIIMGTIPLTLGGAIVGLILLGETVNASVMVGFILLIGIVVNNGIFLIEATNFKLADGHNLSEAISLAVSERTRPILMTSFSTIFGMLPTILIGGEGSELYRGMAIVNVFGMVSGTILSIVITPLIIEMFTRKKSIGA